MSNRCALRRFDGHGATSYRPTNSEATAQFSSNLAALMAERERQDAGIFQPSSLLSSLPTPQQCHVNTVNVQPVVSKEPTEYYALSDASSRK